MLGCIAVPVRQLSPDVACSDPALWANTSSAGAAGYTADIPASALAGGRSVPGPAAVL